MNESNVASGILLVLVGVWLLLQTLGGDLPRRLLSLAGVKGTGEKDGGGLIGDLLDDVPLVPGLPSGVPGLSVGDWL